MRRLNSSPPMAVTPFSRLRKPVHGRGTGTSQVVFSGMNTHGLLAVSFGVPPNYGPDGKPAT